MGTTGSDSFEPMQVNVLIEPACQAADEIAASLAGTAPAPDSISGYEIIRELHRGGQGVVYQAMQKATRRRVAIKVMKDAAFADSREKARFEREVQILGALSHPNIVAIHDSGLSTGHFYYVMDYTSGQPLDVYTTARQRSVDDSLRLFGKICDAVNAAHLKGVIHRDLKPGNIVVDANGEPHVLDFGLAKMALGGTTGESRPAMMTVTGQFIGSLPWASPEQAEGTPGKIDVRTDVYSLGVILYQMLTGSFPYEVAGNMRAVLDNILKVEPARPSTIRKQVNHEVETIVLKCLAKERERRYQSAGELARDIAHYLAGEPIEAKRDSIWYVIKKKGQRYQTAAVIGFSFLVLLTAAAFVSVRALARADAERKTSEEQRWAARQAKVLSCLEEAKFHTREGDWTNAEHAVNQALSIDPDGSDAMRTAAWILFEKNKNRPLQLARTDFESGSKYCERILNREPNNLAVRNQRGNFLWKLQCYPEAAAEYKKVLSSPKVHAAHEEDYLAAGSNLGVVSCLLGDLPSAERHLRRAVELYGTAKSSEAAMALRNLAALEFHNKDSRAAGHLQQSLDRFPHNPMAWALRAQFRLSSNDPSEVAAALDDAVTADVLTQGLHARAKRIRALAHLRNLQFELAALQARSALSLGDDPTRGNVILAIAHARTQPDEANEADGAGGGIPCPPSRQGIPEFSVAYDADTLWFDSAFDVEDLCKEWEEALGKKLQQK